MTKSDGRMFCCFFAGRMSAERSTIAVPSLQKGFTDDLESLRIINQINDLRALLKVINEIG